MTYTVVAGDTLFSIARRFNVTLAELRRANRLTTDQLRVGQVLHIPTRVSSSAPSERTGSLPSQRTYRVRRGDTLFNIARRFGVTADELKRYNDLHSNALRVGQVLKIPSKAIPPTPPIPAPPLPSPPPIPSVPSADPLVARRRFTLRVLPEMDFRRYELTVPLPDGTTIIACMRDNITQSAHMRYPEGVLYPGQSSIHLPIERVASVGLTRQQAAALEFVSTHEGKYDAINTYDDGIFSYGCIQFVGALAHGASLNRLLGSMKRQAPERFAQIFQQVGIDHNGDSTTVLDDAGRWLSGDEAWLYLQRNIPLYGAFIQAGFDADLVLEQLRMANELYVQPTLNTRLQLNIGSIVLQIPRLGSIISSEGLLTALIAIAINRGTGAMGRLVSEVLAVLAQAQGINTVEALRQLDEQLICRAIADTAADVRIRQRAQGAIDAGLSFDKTA